jgi:hypothetical protein
MKKIVLIVTAFLGISTGSAFATCTSPAVMHDFASTAFNMSLATNAGDGNCASNVGIIGTLPPFANPPSIANTSFGISGTLPGYTSTPTFNLGTLNGAATAAKQPAIGTAGTPSADVISVQGVSGGTPQPISAASGAIGAGAFAAGSISNGANPVEGTITTAHGCSIAGYTIIGCLGQIDDDVKGPIAAGTNTIGTTGSLPYPVGAVPVTASATGTTGATTATLPASTTGQTTYVCGYSIRANATANTNVTNTLTGVISGTMSSAMWVPANTAGLGVDEQIFQPCIPGSAVNTAISAVSGAPGAGGVVTVKAWGFKL